MVRILLQYIVDGGTDVFPGTRLQFSVQYFIIKSGQKLNILRSTPVYLKNLECRLPAVCHFSIKYFILRGKD